MSFDIDPRSYQNTDSVARIRRSLKVAQGEDSAQLKAVKEDTQDIVSAGIAQFRDNMTAGRIEISSIADLERLVKLGLLVEGSATEITQDNSQSAVIEISDADYETLSETEEFEAFRKRLSGELNEANSKEL